MGPGQREKVQLPIFRYDHNIAIFHAGIALKLAEDERNHAVPAADENMVRQILDFQGFHLRFGAQPANHDSSNCSSEHRKERDATEHHREQQDPANHGAWRGSLGLAGNQ